jgi:hypothetical protein
VAKALDSITSVGEVFGLTKSADSKHLSETFSARKAYNQELMRARLRQNQLILERTADESPEDEDENNINAESKVIKEFDEGSSQLIRTTKLDDV